MINKKTLNTLIRVFFWGTVITGALLLAAYAHGSTSSTKRGNAIGSVQYQENPFTYKVGKVYAVGVVDNNLVLRIQPLATYELFTEDVLLCGLPQSMFVGKHDPFVLTYKTQASRLVQGIGCHTLIRVDELHD